MKWGIIAAGTIARRFAHTINQMEDEMIVATGSRGIVSAHAFATEFDIPRPIRFL